MTIAQKMLDKYIQAEQDVLEGKSVTFEGRSMSMENLQEIRAGRQGWQRRVNAESPAAKKFKSFGGLGMRVARFDGK